MQSVARPRATVVDLLDRILDRGLILDADILISLAGVPLIGVKLRVALAGMETMVQYGLMQDWDQGVRQAARANHEAAAAAEAAVPPPRREDLAAARVVYD